MRYRIGVGTMIFRCFPGTGASTWESLQVSKAVIYDDADLFAELSVSGRGDHLEWSPMSANQKLRNAVQDFLASKHNHLGPFLFFRLPSAALPYELIAVPGLAVGTIVSEP